MSRYYTIVLSFSDEEFEKFEGEEYQPPDLRDCEPLRKIDAWLKRRHYEPLLCLSGSLCSNAVLYGGTYNKLDFEKLFNFVQGLKWHSIGDVRILFWDEEDSTFSVIEFPLT